MYSYGFCYNKLFTRGIIQISDVFPILNTNLIMFFYLLFWKGCFKRK